MGKVAQLAQVEVTARGQISAPARSDAATQVAAVLRQASEPVRHARVTLTRLSGPALARPVVAEANLDLNGRFVRAQVAAADPREAIDLLVPRLRRRLARLARHWQARSTDRPDPNWRSAGRPTDRPDYQPRSPGERELVARTLYQPAGATADEAAFDLELMDYDFHVFVDAASGCDSMIYRVGADSYRMVQLVPHPDRQVTAVPLTVSDQPAPRLSLAEAVTRLDHSGAPFLFFADTASGRGCALYRRYDGHYGLVAPDYAAGEHSGTLPGDRVA